MTELRYVLRALRKSPAFSLAVIFTMALGIGATTSIFAVVNAVALKTLPYAESSRIVSISLASGGIDQGVVRAPWVTAWEQSARSFDALAVGEPTSGALTEAGESRVIGGRAVTAGYFRVFGVSPIHGRTFAADEFTVEDGGPVVVGYALWRDALGSDAQLADHTITLDGKTRAVIGVMPQGFAPDNAQYWETTRVVAPEVSPLGVNVRYYTVIARAKPGVQIDNARAELASLARRSEETLPAIVRDTASTVRLMTLHDRLYGEARRPVMLLTFAVAFLLIIACANVANLSLARAAARRHEFAVRTALGASRWRLARYAILESVVLALAGGTLGLLIPLWTLPVFLKYRPASLVNVSSVPITTPVLLFTAAAAILTGIVFGLFPAAASSRRISVALHETAGHASGGRTQRRVRYALIVGQLAVALALVTGAALMTRSLVNVLSIDPGFRPGNTLVAAMRLPSARYPNAAARLAFFRDLRERVIALPGVDAVAYSFGQYPLMNYRPSNTTTDSKGKKLSFAIAVVGRDYPQAAGLAPIAGRLFDNTDGAGSSNVVVLNASAAKQFFPDQNAVGQSFTNGKFATTTQCSPIVGGKGQTCSRFSQPATVIGVVADVGRGNLEGESLAQVYQLVEQTPDASATYLLVRARDDGASLAGAVRAAAKQVDALVPVTSIRFLSTELEMATAPRRFGAALMLVFALVAVVLAGVGLYGVMAYQIAQRNREFGIRLALGAQGGQLLTRVLAEGLVLAALGIAGGSAMAFALSRLMRGFLYGVQIHDPIAFAAAPVLLLIVALLASYVPARRAARVDPMIALRNE